MLTFHAYLEPPAYTPSDRFREILPEEAAPDREVADRTRVTEMIDESRRVFEDLRVSDESAGDFENLFETFQQMKGMPCIDHFDREFKNLILSFTEKASQLQGNERLLFAEETAMAFWRAIGGEQEDENSTKPSE